MFATEEDMNELDRAVHLLRKGYLVQKSAVSASIEFTPVSVPRWTEARILSCLKHSISLVGDR